ncbi:MAG TPA: fibronectin type III domain-containing protein [Thermodesulfovibrionales bacterium]|nr:fibronectin type III domain-containing protein [Thermodesulfovibrionales bacterium]
MIILIGLFAGTVSYASWQGPTDVLSGGWGSGDTSFGLESGDTSDRLPSLAAVLSDGRIVISDEVNEREVIYTSNGTLLKIVPWDITQNGSKVANPEYPKYQYWNVQGFTSEGNIWIKIDDFMLKSSSGEVLKTYSERPPELGIIKEQKIPINIGDLKNPTDMANAKEQIAALKKYRITVTFPDKVWGIVGKGMIPYMRDMNGNLYGYGERQAIRYNSCGKELARLTVPKETIEEVSRGEQVEPLTTVLEQYGSPVLAPNGDVYTWKRTPDKYSIIKWTWQDDPNPPANVPDSPTDLATTSSATALGLAWKASLQDPGCVTGYEIARSITAGAGYSTLGAVDKSVFKYEDSTAEADKTYYYKVRAKGGDGYSDYSNEASGKR